MPLPLHLFQVEVDAALSKILLLEASEQRHVVLCEDLPLRTRDAARQHGHAVHRRRAAPVNEPAVHLPVGVAPEVGIVGVQVWVLEADVPREEAEVEPDVLLEGTRLLHAVCKGREEGLAGEVRGVALLRSVTNKLGQRVRHLLGAPLAALAGLLGHLRGPGEGPQQRRAQVGAPELCRHGVEEAELVPGGQTGLRPHQRVIHLVPHSRLQLEVQILLSQRQTLVGFEGLLLLLAKLDKLGDEDVVGVWPADVREVVLRRLEGEDWAQEAVDGALLEVAVSLCGALHAPDDVAAHLLGPLHGPGHLHEELRVEACVRLGVLDRHDGLWPGAPGGVLRRGRQALELEDLRHGVVEVQGLRRVEGLREPLSTKLVQVPQGRRNRKAVAVTVERLLRLDLHVLLRQPHPRGRGFGLTRVEGCAVLFRNLPARLEVSVHAAVRARGRAARRAALDLPGHEPLHVGLHWAHDLAGPQAPLVVGHVLLVPRSLQQQRGVWWQGLRGRGCRAWQELEEKLLAALQLRANPATCRPAAGEPLEVDSLAIHLQL
mmetsp:Transcript_18822/g.59813  ORF Transcript_18822/g.59813 Transcript_18822/m.59813 type:complete len:545 (+) Transcript_18822:364-1998(+)